MSELALLGGKPVREKPYPSWPRFGEEEKKLLLEVLESREWWRGGELENPIT